MIFRRALLREFSQTALGVFIALIAILLTTQAIRLLAEAAGGKLPPAAVLALLGFGAVNYLPVVLSLALFIAVLMTLSRAYRDSEMVVWFAAGQPLTGWIRPVLRFALPLVLTIAALSLFLSPWALNKSANYRQHIDSRDDVSKVSPGNFNESSGSDRVFFVEEAVGDQSRVRNVFVSSVQNGRLGVMAAAEGYTDMQPNGDRFLVMENGRRYEGVPGQPDYRVMEFERYSVRVETKEARGVDQNPGNMPLKALLSEPTPQNLAEILWRVGLPFSALMLALLAIPLSFVNPRAGRTSNLIFAILIYMLYSNLLSISQAWVRQGKVPFEIGVWLVHGVMALVLVGLLWRRMAVFGWRRRWR